MTWQSPQPPVPGPQEQPTVPSRTSRRWLVPVAAGTGGVLIAGVVVGYLALQPDPADAGRAAATAAASPAGPASPGGPPAEAPEVCSMIDAAEVQRLVPEASISDSMHDQRESAPGGYVTWSCTWSNPGYSFGEYVRERSIMAKVTLHVADKERTADAASRDAYGFHLRQSRYNASTSAEKTAPATKKGEPVVYYSPVRKLAGIGDEAHAQYTWSKGENGWAHGSGYGRVGELTVEVEYKASQRRKDSPLFTAKGRTLVTEENALREVELILRQISESVAAWRQGRPYARATVAPAPSPTPAPTPSPTPVAFPAACTAVDRLGKRLVPDAQTKAERSYDGRGRTSLLCRWLNRDIPAGAKRVRLRNAVITFHDFVNRAGVPDTWAAKQYYIDLRAKAKEWERSGFQGLFYHKVTEPKGLGDQAYFQYRENRTPTVHAGLGEGAVLVGSTVIEIFFAGSERPVGAPLSSPESVLLPQRQSLAGARSLAEAVVTAFRETGTG